MDPTKTLTVPLPNEPGTLATLTKVLSKEGVNIEGIYAEAYGDAGYARIVADNPTKAQRALAAKGYTVYPTDTVAISLPNRPGELARVTSLLADADVNITGLYATPPAGEDTGTLYLRVDDPEAATEALATYARRTTPVVH